MPLHHHVSEGRQFERLGHAAFQRRRKAELISILMLVPSIERVHKRTKPILVLVWVKVFKHFTSESIVNSQVATVEPVAVVADGVYIFINVRLDAGLRDCLLQVRIRSRQFGQTPTELSRDAWCSELIGISLGVREQNGGLVALT